MTTASYRAAARAYRDAIDLVGTYRGSCLLCGHPDQRHRAAEAMVGMLDAGEDPAVVVEEHGSRMTVSQLLALADVVRAARPVVHKVSRKRVAGYDREVWSELFPAPINPPRTAHPTGGSVPVFINDLMQADELDSAIEDGLIRVQTSPDGSLRILNYTEKAVYAKAWTPATMQSRGMIVDSSGRVLARPFRKFFNYGEHAADTLDLTAPVEVTDKIDGSLGILYRTPDGLPAIATRGSFASEQAIHATDLYRAKYHGQWLPGTDFTFLFEIVYPGNRIVLDYGDMDDLVLLGGVEIATGRVFGPMAAECVGWPGPRATVYDYPTLADALAAEPRTNAEGLVVSYLDGPLTGTQVKIKQEDYVRLHALATRTSTITVWETLMAGQRVLEAAPDMPDEFLAWVESVEGMLLTQHAAFIDAANAEYERVSSDVGPEAPRKDFASAAASSPHRAALFRILDGKDITEMAWKAIRPEWQPARMISEDVA